MSDWYQEIYQGEDNGANPFASVRSEGRNGALHAHLAGGHSILSFPRQSPSRATGRALEIVVDRLMAKRGL